MTTRNTSPIPPTAFIDVATLRAWLEDGGEIAFVDIREEGIHGEGHPLLAVNIPYSRLERAFPELVPRPATRIVLLSEEGAVGPRAARHLAAAGYGAVHVLQGGAAAWTASGGALFPSTNVPSKAFAEVVEHAFHTPDIEAAALDTLRRAKSDVVVLDSRTREEFGRFHVPGAISAPGAELVQRFAELVPSPETFVVVSCAGRTRGIIGAQALINAGVPNRVAALSGGTQGWRLAGLELERDHPASAPAPLTPAAREAALQRAAGVAARFGVPVIDRAAFNRLRAEAGRTTYLFDVRSPAEYAEGHAAGAVSAESGQLVQALDKWAATRGARIVLTDDDGVRATVAGHWLRQLGWDVSVLPGLIAGVAPTAAHPVPAAFGPGLAGDAPALVAEGAVLISVDPSSAYRVGHPQGALWANRSRLDGVLPALTGARSIVVTAQDTVAAQLVARDLVEITTAQIAVLPGGVAAWRAAGLEVVASPGAPADAEQIDYLFWLHDRHGGNPAASRAYLDWELTLPGAVRAEAPGFRLVAA